MPINEKEAIRLWDEEGMTQAEIARRFGVTRQYINLIFKKHNINTTEITTREAQLSGADNVQGPVVSPKVLKVLEMFANGSTRLEICDAVDLSKRTVDGIIYKHFSSDSRAKALRNKPTLTNKIKDRLEQGKTKREISKELGISHQAIFNMVIAKDKNYMPTFPKEEQEKHRRWMAEFLDDNGWGYIRIIPHRKKRYSIQVSDFEIGQKLAAFLKYLKFEQVIFSNIVAPQKRIAKRFFVKVTAKFTWETE